jgi:hypothetical protein
VIFDKLCEQLTGENQNLLVPWWLMACYAYYIEDDPILSDAAFEKLWKRLDRVWTFVQHQHKDWIDGDALQTGGYLGEADYPVRIPGAVAALRLDNGGARK